MGLAHSRGSRVLQYILAKTQSPVIFYFTSFFPDQHFSMPVTPSSVLCGLGQSGTTLGLPSILEALATTSHPPAEFPFWATSSIHTAPPWVTHSDKSSHRHAICWGVVGLAWALGGFC